MERNVKLDLPPKDSDASKPKVRLKMTVSEGDDRLLFIKVALAVIAVEAGTPRWSTAVRNDPRDADEFRAILHLYTKIKSRYESRL